METIAVVPIFVNAGAAVLPAVVAMLASTLSLLLRPRDLLRAVIRRPLRTVVVVAAMAAGAGGAAYLWHRAATPRADPAAVGQVDWARIARDILERRSAGPSMALVPATGPVTCGPRVLGGDFSRSGYDNGGSPLGLRLAWAHRQENAMFLSSPAVVRDAGGGRVFAAACLLDVAGKFGVVVCLDAERGTPLWQTTAIGQEPLRAFFSSPAVSEDGQCVIIGQGLHDDANCSLLCFDANTGCLRWQVPTPLHIEGSPAIKGDMVVVGAGAIEADDHKPISHPGLVLAVRISDGKVLWQYEVNDPESSPAIAEDGTVYIGSGFNGSAVVALRSRTDRELREANLPRLLWRSPAPHPVTGAVTLAGERVIVGCGNGDFVFADPHPAGAVLALSRRTGEVLWQALMPDAVLGAVACRGDRLICPVRNGEIVALDLARGQVLWRCHISGIAPVLAGPAYSGTHVYAVSRDGYLAVIGAADGGIVQKLCINEEGKPGELGLTLSSPTISGGRLYVGSETGGLRCLVGARVPAAQTAKSAEK